MKIYIGLALLILIIGCAGTGMVEVGMNDEGIKGTAGDIAMRILRLEIPSGGDYTAIWDGEKNVQVAIESSDYITITDGYIDVTPGTYQRMRLTVDSVRYVQDTVDIMLIQASYQFVANAFTPIVIEDADELQLVVNIAAAGWFDIDSLKIREGFEAFDGAQLKIYYAP